MAKFNVPGLRPAATSPVKAERRASGTTALGAPGFARDEQGELFLLAVNNMVGEDRHHEQAEARDSRFMDLVRAVAVADPDWMARFLPWLRAEANMRSASLVAGLEAARAMVAAGIPGGRQIVAAVLQRADEPGEAIAYWFAHYGTALPKPVKRGIADAVMRLGTEFNYVKWGQEGAGVSFDRILNLTHPGDRASGQAAKFKGEWQRDLFGYVVKRRYQDELRVPESLGTLNRRAALMALPVDERRAVLEDPELLARAGITWEALAGWLQGPMDAAAWEAIIPSMGYMALLRNLRNFDEAGVSDTVAAKVGERLADPDQVAKARQFPFRFYAAFKNTGSIRWDWALERALRASLSNVPALKGRTLVCVDQSPSMFPGYHCSTPNTSDISLADQATLFGSAVALRAEAATLIGYGGSNYEVPFRPGDAILTTMGRFHVEDYTDTAAAVAEHYAGHDRVVIVTDEQTASSRTGRTVDQVVPKDVAVYTWNVGGYARGHAPSGRGRRHAFGGLTDAAFRLIPLLERGRGAPWPF